MAAYMIVFAAISDRERFINDYGIPAGELVARYGGEYVVRAPGVTSLEGGLFEGSSAVISKWPDKAAIEAFWNSEDYQALKALRQTLATAHVMVIEDMVIENPEPQT